MLPSPIRDQPFGARMLVFGFAAFGATCLAGVFLFSLANTASRRTPNAQKFQDPPCTVSGKEWKELDRCICEDFPDSAVSIVSGKYGPVTQDLLQRRDLFYASVRRFCPSSQVDILRDRLDQAGRPLGLGFTAEDAEKVWQAHKYLHSIDENNKGDLSANEGVPKNTYVSDNLNTADGLFKNGSDGCPSVTLAIIAANSPDLYGDTSASQRAELKSYAERCGLRF